jgi:hypothetical protein
MRELTTNTRPTSLRRATQREQILVAVACKRHDRTWVGAQFMEGRDV